MKAERSRLIPRKHTQTLVLLSRGGLRLCGTPGWNLERGPFDIYETVVNKEKINEQADVFAMLKQKNLTKKRIVIWYGRHNMNETHWFQSLHFLLETWDHIDKCSQNTGGMFLIYSGTRRPPPRYRDRFNAVFPMLMHYLLFHQRNHPGIQTAATVQLFKAANRAPRNTTTIFYRYSYARKLVTCQQQCAQLHHAVLKHRKYRDVGVRACAVSANVT